MRRVVKHLESPQFVARLAHLTPRDAAIVTGAVARIKKATTGRWLAMSEYQQRHPAFGRRPPTPAEQAALARLLDEQEIRDAYLAALAAAGFAVVDVPAHSPALREISLECRRRGFACSTESTPVATGVLWCSGSRSIGASTATRSAAPSDYGKSS